MDVLHELEGYGWTHVELVNAAVELELAYDTYEFGRYSSDEEIRLLLEYFAQYWQLYVEIDSGQGYEPQEGWTKITVIPSTEEIIRSILTHSFGSGASAQFVISLMPYDLPGPNWLRVRLLHFILFHDRRLADLEFELDRDEIVVIWAHVGR